MRRHRKLLIDEVGDPGFARLRHQGLAERLEGFALMGIEQPERNAARPRFSGRHDDFSAAYRKRQRPRVAPLTKPRRPMSAIVISSRSDLIYWFLRGLQERRGITGQPRPRVQGISSQPARATGIAENAAHKKKTPVGSGRFR